MDPSTSYAPPNMFTMSPENVSSINIGPPGDLEDKTSSANTQTHHNSNTDPRQPSDLGHETNPKTPNVPLDQSSEGQFNRQHDDLQYNRVCPPLSTDLVEEIKGMYRLLDLINESGSNGCVDKIVIAQESLERFINAMSPGTYESLTKVDFKTLDQLIIKPLGVYGSKVELVRLLRSLNAVNEDTAGLLLAPTTKLGGDTPALSSGLYVVATGAINPTREPYYVIYWPEDSTWDDSAPSSVSRNRVTFMRYLTKICDQVVALLSEEHSTSLVWGDDGDGDAESIDIDTGEEDRLFTYEVEKRNEQEDNADSRPGFQLKLPQIPRHAAPAHDLVDPSMLVPHLLHGETVQGFRTATYVPQFARSTPLQQRSWNKISLQQLLNDNALVLSESLDDKAVQILINVALSNMFPSQCHTLQVDETETRKWFVEELTRGQEKAHQDLRNQGASLQRALLDVVVDDVVKSFPSIQRDAIFSHVSGNHSDMNHEVTRVDSLRLMYPDFEGLYKRHVEDAKFDVVKKTRFRFLKERLAFVRHILKNGQQLAPETRTELIQALLAEVDLRHVQQILTKPEKEKGHGNAFWSKYVVTLMSWSWIRGTDQSPGTENSGSKITDVGSLKKEMKNIANDISDSQFLLELNGMEDEVLRAPIQEAVTLAQTALSSSIDTTVKAIVDALLRKKQDEQARKVRHDIETDERRALHKARMNFIREVNKISAGRSTSLVQIDDVRKVGKGRSAGYEVTGHSGELEKPKLEFRVYLMDLMSGDMQGMQLDPMHLPSPVVSDRRSGRFHLTLDLHVVFHQLLENDRQLLVLSGRDKHSIYLERISDVDAAIRRAGAIKTLGHDHVGKALLFAYNETRRTLTVCAPVEMKLYAFLFDETFKTLQAQGSAIDLAPWYSQTEISILQLASVCGSDEVAVVDSSARVRIFSFVTQQFRPASLRLPSLPSAVYPSPDESCLLVLHLQGSQPCLTAYHWDTFGSTHGIPLQIPTFPLEGAVVTSMVSRGRVFLLALDIDAQCINSIAIDITKKMTEVVFREKGSRNVPKDGTRQAQHNVLLDCHKEVWTRFPVLPAIKRRTITSLSERRPRTLTFITDCHTQPFASYFSDLVRGFMRETKKPTGDELRNINVSATDFKSFRDQTVVDLHCNVSQYRVGEWLVDLLCLIPIHIAVCRENRFIPLANGVLTADSERSLLGADVNQIVDKLSFGWYESIFQSYMASKPVKVVSSMGQQSVGKSYSLNHLVDTSFAGSAMRTTEGVWMSVTPTDDQLIVALDFEGVDSVERSLQEDTLLVLFNTAISNLVLFRNNFAFSRDISGLFQSFQSSASVLDPAANPSLFQSTLVIIIKDVLESDKNEIALEFSLKFNKIVEQEKDANFISRLHSGKLDIIPWPVIKSREFYKCFTTLKKRLDLQKISHPTAGEFLHTIKTLMAKLMANDWGALSQTMAEHRAKSLSTLLSVALATGFSETKPQLEPLKDIDTDLVLESNDTAAIFAVSEEDPIPQADLGMHLAALFELWSPSIPRQSIPDSDWLTELRIYLNGLVDLRVNHVRAWLDCNLGRFQGGHAAIDDLRRRFDNMAIEMKANVQLCGATCASCHLLCTRSRLHDGDHECNTSHECAHNCGFCEDDLKLCSSRAGHPGKHICVVSAHLCGEPCKLSGRRGCLEDCIKVNGHADDDHMCSAPVHMCGEPCALQGLTRPGGKIYSCPERCSIPSDQDHEIHSCDSRLCPSVCELCKRLCNEPHLHGLTPRARHLCGEAHACSALCSDQGICQIDTAPQSIEATFTGRHETFQYTKYTQVAKRLQCIRIVPPGRTSHEGPHTHSKEDQPFHFCEARCENCGYFCTLPLGHAQQEHETSHGSMTKSSWAIDGPDGTSLELGGRKFSSSDEGAPMMCNLVCSSMGRHVHIGYCRTEAGGPCDGAEVQHINERIVPNPNQPKDFTTHGLYWRRMGFKDPYTRDEQTNFSKCDSMCSGPEHLGTPASTGQPSYCTLPMFHPARNPDEPVDGLGYTSNDGHLFECNNPVVMQQAFHVVFIVDRSGSMSFNDRLPLADAPMTNQIQQSANNRLGAVYSALYSFWMARHTATAGRQTSGARRDAYSIILFNQTTANVLTNDFTSTPDELLDAMLRSQAYGGTNFSAALRAGQAVMEQHWSTERAPVMIFLSDGECSVPDTVIQDLCRSAVALGKPLSYHSISFGPESSSSSLRRMANLALGVQNNAPRDPLMSQTVQSSFSIALDTVRLAETFLGIAESLRKPRGSLIC